VWPARGFSNFISAASILRLCKAVRVQFSDPYRNVGKTSVLYIYIILSTLNFFKQKLQYSVVRHSAYSNINNELDGTITVY